MKRTKKSLTFFLLFSTIILPFLPILTVAQEEEDIVFRRSTSSLAGEWDPSVTDWYNTIIGSYGFNALEYPIGTPVYYSAGVDAPIGDEWKPILVTDWEFEMWPIEPNQADKFGGVSFNNTGGFRTTTFTLRENVTFTDGSAWNATVFKWNIDRSHLINGNYTGAAQGNDDWELEGDLLGTILVEDNKPYFTNTWNMSHFDSPNIGLVEPTILPKVTDYAYYDLGPDRSLVDYPGVDILLNGTVRNENPYGGWDDAAGSPIHWAPYDRFPGVAKVEILESKASGGKIKVYHNTWDTGGFGVFVNFPMLSYAAYKDNYTIHAVYGYENGVKSTNNPTTVDHMIGTGPYIFVEHEDTGTPPGGHMVKNENYWNKTALEADGWFDVDRVEVIKFPAGELGKDAQNVALLTHAIDYAFDSMFQPLDYNAVLDNKNIRYEDAVTSPYLTNIVLNTINETWWAWPDKDQWRMGNYPKAGNFSADGVPMAMREAMSYAYNYDLMIHTVLDDRAVRGGGALGKGNLYYNSSIPVIPYNKTKAREILLTTETDTSGQVYNAWNLAEGYNPPNDLYNFSKLCADRGLSASSTDNDWIFVAENNPIYEFNYYWDSAHQDATNVLIQSLKEIGVAIVAEADNKVTTIIWETVQIGHLTTFDGDHSLFSCNGWIMDEDMPHDTPQLNTFWHYVDPDRGRWRTDGVAGITSNHYWGNFGFNFDARVDLIFDRIATSAPTEKKKYFSQLAEIQQTERFGVLYLYQAKEGWAMWKDFETWLVEDREGHLSGLWGGVTNAFLRFVGLPDTYALIPGAPMLLTVTISILSILGIIYALMRKTKKR